MLAGQLEIQLIADVARLAKDMNLIEGHVSKAMGNIDRVMGVANKALGVFGIGLSAVSFANMVKGSIDAADHLNDLSKSTGLNVKQLAGLQLAAKQTGGELDGTAKAINMLSKNMGQNEEKFRRMGITAKEPLEAFKQLSDRFVAIQDPSRRAAFAADTLGKSWETVAPLLAEGAANIQSMVDKGARLSGVTQDMASQADEFNDNLELLKASTSGWATSIAGSLLPALIGASDFVFKLVNHEAWLEQQADKTTQSIKEQAEALKMMSLNEVAREIQKTRESIDAKEDEIAKLEKLKTTVHELSDARKSLDEQTKLEGMELAALNAQMANSQKRLADMKAGIDETTDAVGGDDGMNSKVAELIASLEQQNKMMGMTAREQAMFKAEIDAIAKNALPEEIAKVRELAGTNYDLKESLEAAADASKQAWDQMVADVVAAGEEQKRAAEEQQRVITDLNEIYAASGKAAEEAAHDAAVANAAAAKKVEDDWRTFRDSLGDMFANTILDGDGSFFDKIGDSFKKLLAKMAGDLLASGVMTALTGQGGFSLAGTLSSAGTAGSMTSGLIQKFAPSLASKFGLSAVTGGMAAAETAAGAANYVAAMEAGGATFAGGSAASTGLMAGLKGALTSIPGWGWALAGAATLAMMFDKKSTPSYNAGFLTDPNTPLGKSGQSFQTSAFASGFQPLGFYRRSSQAEAEQVIELFRALDSSIVEMTRNAGLTASLTALRGYKETLLPGTTGTVFGAGGEDGKPGTALDQQLQLFASQLIESLRGQLDDAVLNDILSASSVDQMLSKLESVLTVEKDVVDTLGDAAVAAKSAADTQLAAVESWQNAVASASDYITDVSRKYMEEQERLIRDYWNTQMEQERDLHNRRFSLFRSLMEYTNSLRLGDLSPLNAVQKLSLAQSNFDALYAKSQNNSLSMDDRVTAAEGLQGASESLLNARRSAYASQGYGAFAEEILQKLDAAKFLGTTGKFNASPYENAMLDELKKLNEQTAKLPSGIAASLVPIMANLINQGLLAGKSKEYIANTVTGLGKDAVTAADTYLGKTGNGTIADYATSTDTIKQYAEAVRGQSSTEAEMVASLVAKAKEYGLSANTVGDALGLSGAQTQDVLKKYGIQSFDVGTNFVPRDMLANVHQGERIIPKADNAQLISNNKEVIQNQKTLIQQNAQIISILMAKGDYDGQQMSEQTEVLRRMDRKLQPDLKGSAEHKRAG